MNFLKKWNTYQKERFPVLIYGLYIFCIVFAVFCFSSYMVPIAAETFLEETNVNTLLPVKFEYEYLKLIPMFIFAFLQFLMVRIVDEFKDYEEDSKYRPYRPVPRGLVTLKELKLSGFIKDEFINPITDKCYSNDNTICSFFCI